MSRAERGIFEENGIALTCRESIEPLSELSPFDALLVVAAKLPAEVVRQLTLCRVISRYGIGVDNIDVNEATSRGIVVTNVPDFCTSEMADHTIALLLALARKLLVMDRCTRQGRWQARVEVPTHRVAGKTLGLVGFGRIAQAVARRAKTFGLQILTCDPNLQIEAVREIGVRPSDLETLLTNSDYVSLHAPLTAATRHIIGERELNLMKPDAFLINTARGGLVDEDALANALRQARIAGAGLDVYESLAMFDPNPLQTDHPLFHLENVVLTPHSGGCSMEALEQVKTAAAEQAIAVLNGDVPSNVVNPAVLARADLRDRRGATSL